MNTNKPLSEWTLREIKAECEKHIAHCVGCPLWTDAAGCRLDTSCYRDNDPKKWDLSEPPRWTEQDKEDAKTLKRLIVTAHYVWRYSEKNNPQLFDRYDDYISVLGNCFAALPPQVNVTLDEIIGGAE